MECIGRCGGSRETLPTFALGSIILNQAEFTNRAIDYICVSKAALGRRCSLILLGHSMGGVVARSLSLVANYNFHLHSVTIITFNAPHR
jgi:alpha-beta hydrolase superfamily lysophospholipase